MNSYNVAQYRKLPHAYDESYIDTARNVLFLDSSTLKSGGSSQPDLVQNLIQLKDLESA